MGCDLVVALGRATAEGGTLLGFNADGGDGLLACLRNTPRRMFAPGELLRAEHLEIPQVRETYATLGFGWADRWGYDFGINEHSVAAGRVSIPHRSAGMGPRLLGSDLVRLVLERSTTARGAVDQLAALVERHGQGAWNDCDGERGGDSAFILTDGQEAFALEAAGRHWVYQEIHEVRAASNVSTIRQDWDGISPELADFAISRGLWPSDGSKLDFAGAISTFPTGLASGLRRWGRATYLLEQQNGHINPAFLRRLLADHYEGMKDEVDPQHPSPGPQSICHHGGSDLPSTSASLFVEWKRDPDRLPALWCAVGPPCLGVYLPLYLAGDVPATLQGAPSCFLPRLVEQVARLHDEMMRDPLQYEVVRGYAAHLQAQLDQEAEEFESECAAVVRRGDRKALHRQATHFMQYAVEQFEAVFLDQPVRGRTAVAADADLAAQIEASFSW